MTVSRTRPAADAAKIRRWRVRLTIRRWRVRLTVRRWRVRLTSPSLARPANNPSLARPANNAPSQTQTILRALHSADTVAESAQRWRPGLRQEPPPSLSPRMADFKATRRCPCSPQTATGIGRKMACQRSRFFVLAPPALPVRANILGPSGGIWPPRSKGKLFSTGSSRMALTSCGLLRSQRR